MLKVTGSDPPMALTDQERILLVGILAVVMMIVLVFEFRYLKSRSKEVTRSLQRKDRAYNAILTARSVMNSLRNQGRPVGEAQAYLDRAKAAMEAGDYEGCMELCEKAKGELTVPRKVAVPKQELQLEEEEVDVEASQRLEEVAEEIVGSGRPASDDSYKGVKLTSSVEGNYLGAKFEISAAKGDISRAAKAGRDVSKAESLLADAESEFALGNFDKSLSLAVRARREVSQEVDREAIPITPEEKPAKAVRKRKQAAEVFDVEKAEEKAGPRQLCKSCGSVLDPEDAFCAGCGAKVVRERVCGTCGFKPRENDAFCRKCGARIT